jgi:methylenetetrahydrofolate dehydrogenase (NADP+)/methenyltetrahydrofolate cyclohydrolase
MRSANKHRADREKKMELRGMPVVKKMAEIDRVAVEELTAKGVIPTLAVIRVGEREDDLSYERGLMKRFDSVGAKVRSIVLDLDVSEEKLIETINECNEDKDIHGILLFRPLPKTIDEKKVIECVSPAKDVDCMCLENIAHTFAQDNEGFEPCTPSAVMEMLSANDIDLTGKNVVVIGRSMVVGKPLAMMLLKKNATVTLCHTRTKDLKGICQKADIICAAAGSPKMVDASFVREGQVIMDVGINVVDGALCGDVDYDGVKDIVEAVTPVPGGVGSVTTSVVLRHVMRGAQKSI